MPGDLLIDQVVDTSSWPSLFRVLGSGETQGILQHKQVGISVIGFESAFLRQRVHLIQHRLHIGIRSWREIAAGVRWGVSSCDIVEIHCLLLAVIGARVGEITGLRERR